MTLNLQHFFTSPLEAVKVTADNMDEVAAWCGGTIAHDINERTKKEEPYVWVPTPEGSKISWAYKNMWITRRCVISMKGEVKFTFSVFRPDYFRKNYFDSPAAAVDATWEKAASERQSKKKAKKEQVVLNQTIIMDPEVGNLIAGMQAQIQELSDSIGVDKKQVENSIVESAATDQFAHNHELVIVEDLLEMDPDSCPGCQFMMVAATEFSKNLNTPKQHGSSELDAGRLVAAHLGVTDEQIETLQEINENNKEALKEMEANPLQEDKIDESDRELPSVLEGKTEAEVEHILNGEESIVVHNHSVDDGCDLHDCNIPRYPSGPAKLIFTDKTFAVSPHGATVEIGHEAIVLNGVDISGETEVTFRSEEEVVYEPDQVLDVPMPARLEKLIEEGRA